MAKRRVATQRQRRDAKTTGGVPEFNNDESPLGWLARRRDRDGRPLISKTAFEAGERLRRDFTIAQMTPGITLNWSALLTGGGRSSAVPESQCDARSAVIAAEQRVRQALAAVGPELSGILIDVCCLLRGLEACEKAIGWPQRSGKVVLQIALSQLARHYGIGRLDDDPVRHDTGMARRRSVGGSEDSQRPARVRHWGAENYRPRSIDDDV